MTDESQGYFVEDEQLGSVFVPDGSDPKEVVEEARKAAAENAAPVTRDNSPSEDVDPLDMAEDDLESYSDREEYISDGQVIASFPVSASELHDEPTLQDEIETALNRYSAENLSGTPDFILAEFLMGCLDSYNMAIRRRAEWRGKPLDRYGYEQGQNDLFSDEALAAPAGRPRPDDRQPDDEPQELYTEAEPKIDQAQVNTDE